MEFKLLSKGAYSELPISLPEAKSQLQIADTDNDTLISAIITRATETAETFTGLALGKRTYTFTIDSLIDADKSELPVYPVCGNTMHVHLTAYYNDSTNTDISTLASLNLLNINKLGTVTSWGIDTTKTLDYIKLEYDAGLGVNVASDIKAAILMLVSEFYENREATSGFSKNELPWGVRTLLGAHANWQVG